MFDCGYVIVFDVYGKVLCFIIEVNDGDVLCICFVDGELLVCVGD